MREILFRAKRNDTLEWAEGYFVKTEDLAYIVHIVEKECTVEIGILRLKQAEWIEVIPETVCVHLGLTDSNGEKIWEKCHCGNVFGFSKQPKESCERCSYAHETDNGLHCVICSHNYTSQFKPMTNADKIRNMSDGDLENFLIDVSMGVLSDENIDMSEWLQAESEDCTEDDSEDNLTSDTIKHQDELLKYREIGTLDECREAVEKNKAKKPIDIEKSDMGILYGQCPSCFKMKSTFGEERYCCKCGQKLEWGSEVE